MIVLALDTSTPATALALRLHDGSILSSRDDPSPGDRPGHSTRLLPLAAGLLADAALRFSDIDRIAVGVGPGTFTGLRIGLATARALAQSLACDLVPVSSLRALAAGAVDQATDGAAHTGAAPDPRSGPGPGDDPGPDPGDGVLAVLDARRGEVFAAAYARDRPPVPRELAPPCVVSPGRLASVIDEASASSAEVSPVRWLALGDGAVRFRDQFELLHAVHVPPDSSPLHLVPAEQICALALHAEPRPLQDVLPHYIRRPDAEIALEHAAGAPA